MKNDLIHKSFLGLESLKQAERWRVERSADTLPFADALVASLLRTRNVLSNS